MLDSDYLSPAPGGKAGEADVSVCPFLKWAGSKRPLLDNIEAHLPAALHAGKITRYVEPFVGGGALFFHLKRHYPITEAYLSDNNPALMLTYRVVRDDVEELIEVLYGYQRKYEAAKHIAKYNLFMDVRAAFNQATRTIHYAHPGAAAILMAAQLIFLNKTCYQGLFRTNKRGLFNTPFGKCEAPRLCMEANLRATSKLLQGVVLRCADYSACESYIQGEDTFVYFDPPYRPVRTSSHFATHAGQPFEDRHQRELAAFYHRMHTEKKAYLMLSNSDPTYADTEDRFFEHFYDGYARHRVHPSTDRHMDRYRTAPELLVLNYIPHLHGSREQLDHAHREMAAGTLH